MELSLVISKEAAERLAKFEDELDRLFSLPDRWLARELLSHARAARDIGHDIFGRDTKLENRYQAELVWDVVPEIAYRLGENNFLKGERGGDIRGLTNAQLRERATEQLHAQPLLVAFASKLHRDMNVYRLLTRHPTVGNPVLFALDRFAPADRTNPDWASRAIWSSFAARGIDDIFEWNPELEEAVDGRRLVMEQRR
ncbi:hypothetical protein HFO56_33455 [Rhizobium laguerreae]|uniref:hypothetical protein n=1 Tax=Rhizobium laguerreae TaxID=1076926 RepID=UPI001C90591A|nr:hypothetical protein [Rhizobium laguerreae]MBY3157234.1 hypothetical protein [Rhizobium laguerreae]